ncbi:MAG: YkgJ family cysteine cluster protein [Acidobacteria bacterium]|nr:YkgJ family cysteine cluster protein [Acidobacteriota bacterium]
MRQAPTDPNTGDGGWPLLALDDRFPFRCGPDLECFNRCCRDVSIVLTPYDVLRARRALGLGSSEFLDAYTLVRPTTDHGIPIVFLKMTPENWSCVFVRPDGCSIYPHRPWACRMYPLGMAESRGGHPSEQTRYFLIREPLCRGHAHGHQMSVREWLDAQHLDEYEAHGAGFAKLLLHEFWQKTQPLSDEKCAMFYIACYDLDRLRRLVLKKSFLDRFEIDGARLEAMATDDDELLEFGIEWLRFCLFGERRLTIKRSAWAAVERRRQDTANGE